MKKDNGRRQVLTRRSDSEREAGSGGKGVRLLSPEETRHGQCACATGPWSWSAQKSETAATRHPLAVAPVCESLSPTIPALNDWAAHRQPHPSRVYRSTAPL